MSEQKVYRTLALHQSGLLNPPVVRSLPIPPGKEVKHQTEWTPTKLMASSKDAVWVVWECTLVLEPIPSFFPDISAADVFRFTCAREGCGFDFHVGGLDIVTGIQPKCVKCGSEVDQRPKPNCPVDGVCTCIHYRTGVAQSPTCKVHKL